MARLLTLGILIISTAPLFAQAQPDPAKLKADAQKVVSGSTTNGTRHPRATYSGVTKMKPSDRAISALSALASVAICGTTQAAYYHHRHHHYWHHGGYPIAGFWNYYH
jgi:hypothetical protein